VFVLKFVVMEKDLFWRVMMEIQYQGMAVVVNALYKVDGHAKEAVRHQKIFVLP
jgi:ATP-dependent Clp protease adapter protein ClpS